MRKLIAVLILLVLCFAGRANAQTRVLVGVAGGADFDNTNFGATLGVEVPFLHYYEIDLRNTFSPIESHVALGSGYANIASVTGRIWLTDHWGLDGRVDDSAYSVTRVTKDADYAFGGLTWRGLVVGNPSRISIDYIRQFNNGITPSGLESTHLQGLDLSFDFRVGCAGPFCFRVNEDSNFGRVLTQGNPQCDGSLGTAITCPRSSAIGGGFNGSVVLEWPRYRATENNQF